MKQWPHDPPQLRHCFFLCQQDQAETDRSETFSSAITKTISRATPIQGSSHCTDGEGTCLKDHCHTDPLMYDDEPCQEHDPEHDNPDHDEPGAVPSSTSKTCHGSLTRPVDRQEDTWTISGQWLVREHRA